jgi:hypothetical protein
VAETTGAADASNSARAPIDAAARPALTRPAQGWRVALGVVWLLAVFLAYYTVHKLVTAADLRALTAPPLDAAWHPLATGVRLLNALADLLAALGLLALAGALGNTLWRALRLPTPGGAEARLVGIVLGLGAFGMAGFFLGLLGLLTRPVVFVLLGVPALALAREGVAQARWWARSARAWWRAGWSGGLIERVAVLFSLSTLALMLPAALLPPTAWDALSYHLVAARANAATGHLALDPANPDIYQPQLTETLYTLLLLLRGGDGAATPLHAGCGVLALALIGLAGWRAGGPRAAVRAVALALAIPIVVVLAGWPYVDLMLGATVLAARAALARWQAAFRRGDSVTARGWLVAAGLATGIALMVKYTGAYSLIALATLVTVAAWRATDLPAGATGERRLPWSRRGWLRLLAALRPAALFGALALAVGSLWPLRNLVVTGDPFFPYHIGPLFPGGPDWDARRTAFMQGGGWGMSALWRAPLLPLEVTLLGSQGSVEFDATLGPLLLLLLPLGLLTLGAWPRARASTDRPGGAAASGGSLPPASAVEGVDVGSAPFWGVGFAGILGLLWAEELARSGVAMQSRLFLPLFLALVVPATLAWLRLDALRAPAVSLGRLVSVAVALCFALTLAGQAVQTLQLDNLAELVGAQSRDAYLAQQLGPYAAAMRRLDSLGPRARVLFLWEPRSYLTHAHVAPDVFLDHFNALYRHCGDSAGIIRCLRAQGYTHLLVYLQGARMLRADGRDSRAELATYDALLAGWQPIYRDTMPLVGAGPPGAGWYALYDVGGAP